MRFSVIAAALVAAAVGFGGTLAIIIAAARNLGANDAEAASWVGSICIGIGVAAIVLSVRHRMPIITAWSLAGGVLIAGLPHGSVTMPNAVGAFIFAGVLMLLSGLVPALGDAVARLPSSLGAGMLAGLVLRFVLNLVNAVPLDPLLVLPLLVVFLLVRRFNAASAPLAVIGGGLVLAALLGRPLPSGSFALAWPVWTTPGWDPVTLIGLGLPLFLVTIATQQVPGAAVLSVSGYVAPMRSALSVSGLVTLLLCPFGAYAVNLASITAAICTGPDVHPDPAKRWPVGVVYGVIYLVLGLCGAGFATMLAGLPPVLVTVFAGCALVGPLTNALSAAMADKRDGFAATVAFATTASGVSILGLTGAFWGLLAGMAVLAMDRYSAGSIRRATTGGGA